MRNKGVWLALAGYCIWGFFPAYWKLLNGVPATEVVAHRLVWSLVFLVIVMTVMRQWESLRAQTTRPALWLYTGAGVLLTINWLFYVYGVNSGRVVEASLGYFINPLVSVLFGVIIFQERLQPVKWFSIGLAALGVIYLTLSYGELPWIALGLALSFGSYGVFKKKAPLGALHGLTVETAAMFIPALVYLLFLEGAGTGSFGHGTFSVSLFMILGGIVTSLPLLMFSSAAKIIPLSLIGILQYITPTLQLMLGVLAYGEPFPRDRMIGFAMIWLALIVFTASGLYERRKALAAAAA